MKDYFKIKGELKYALYDEFGNVKQQGSDNNLIVNGMDAHVAAVMSSGTDSGQIRFIAIGSGAGQTAASSGLQHFVSIIPLSGIGSPIISGNSAVVYSGYWGAGTGTGSIREAGVFRTSGTGMASGLMTYNDTISVNKGANDSLKIDWTVTF